MASLVVVSDHPDIEDIRHLLERLGHRVRLAETVTMGMSALDLLIDLVVVDIDMPDPQVAEVLRAAAGIPDLATLVIAPGRPPPGQDASAVRESFRLAEFGRDVEELLAEQRARRHGHNGH